MKSNGPLSSEISNENRADQRQYFVYNHRSRSYFSDFELRVSRNHFHMKLCNARIDFKISLGLLSWFIIIRKIAFWSVVALQIVDPIFSLFFCNVCPQGGVDLYGDGELQNLENKHISGDLTVRIPIPHLKIALEPADFGRSR